MSLVIIGEMAKRLNVFVSRSRRGAAFRTAVRSSHLASGLGVVLLIGR